MIPFVIEVNSAGQGFQPSYARWRDSTVSRVRPGWMVLMDHLSGPGVRGQIHDQNEKAA